MALWPLATFAASAPVTNCAFPHPHKITSRPSFPWPSFISEADGAELKLCWLQIPMASPRGSEARFPRIGQNPRGTHVFLWIERAGNPGRAESLLPIRGSSRFLGLASIYSVGRPTYVNAVTSASNKSS